MSHPYDASTKYLLEVRLADWLPLCGRAAAGAVEVIDADLATVTAAADRVLRVHETPPWLMHVELQAGRDVDLPANAHMYDALLERRHGPPVCTVIVLLRRSADGPELTGLLERRFPGEAPYLTFRYRVVRLWEMPVEQFLTGGLGILPLAPLAAVQESELPAVIARMDERLRTEATPAEAGVLWTAADVLMGLRYPRTLVADLLRGIHVMKESVTYQAIVEEGMVKARQTDLLRLGKKRYGSLDDMAEKAVRSITDPDRLAHLIDQIYEVQSWQELLGSGN